MLKNNWPWSVCGFSLFVLFSLWMVYGVPMNMDEALPYHALSCSGHPNSFWHIFRESCDHHYDITTPFGLTYSRAYIYVGGLSSFLYAPFYHQFFSEKSQFVYGILYYMPFMFILSRLTSKPTQSFFLFLAFFPVLFQFVHDTGPIKFSAIVFVLTPLTYRILLNKSRSLQIIGGVAIGSLFGLATEEKVFFVYLLLPLALFMLAETHKTADDKHPVVPLLGRIRSAPWKQLALFILAETHKSAGQPHPIASFLGHIRSMPWKQNLKESLSGPNTGGAFIIALSLTSLIAISMIFFSTVPSGQHYLSYIRQHGLHLSFGRVMDDFKLYILMWPHFAHREYKQASINYGWLLQLGTLMLKPTSVVVYKRNAPLASCPPLRVRFLLASSFSLLLLSMITGTFWAGHHYVFAWIPIMVLFAEIIAGEKAHQRQRLMAFYFAINLLSVLSLIATKPIPSTLAERSRIYAYFNEPKRSADSIINYSSWGGYYIHALYSPRDALVTYIEPLKTDETAKLMDAAQRTNRKIYNVCSTEQEACSAEKIEQAFSSALRFKEVPLGLKVWRVYESQTP